MAKKTKKIVVQMKPAKPKKEEKKKEMTRLGGALRTLGGLGGRFLGNVVGLGDAGASVGTGLGAALSRWLGSGDYVVSSNSIVQRTMSAGGVVPAMHKESQSITVRHREFLCEVTSSTSFTVQRQFNINPGLSTTFPWLSSIASQYSEYRVRGMVFHYVPTSGYAVSGTNPALGSVMLQTTYRATESAPTTRVEMLNEYWASEGAPSSEFCHPIECNPKENPFNVQYVRIGSIPSTENQLMYDLGTVNLAVSGQQASGNVMGDLWVTYEIELKKPRLTGLTGEDLGEWSSVSSTNINTTTPFGTDIAARGNTSNAISLASNGSILFGPGSTGVWYITIVMTGTAIVIAPSAPVLNNLTAFAINGDAVGRIGTGSAVSVRTYAVSITNPGVAASVQFPYTTITNVNFLAVTITRINPGISW